MVEMLIVLSVIGVVLAIAIPNFLRSRHDAKIKEARAQLEMISAAILQLAWDTGRWPAGIDRTIQGNAESWDLNAASAGLLDKTSKFPNWEGPYVAKIPKDPWGMPYFFDPDYRVDGKFRAVVGSFGPNRYGRNVYDKDNIYIIVK